MSFILKKSTTYDYEHQIVAVSKTEELLYTHALVIGLVNEPDDTFVHKSQLESFRNGEKGVPFYWIEKSLIKVLEQ